MLPVLMLLNDIVLSCTGSYTCQMGYTEYLCMLCQLPHFLSNSEGNTAADTGINLIEDDRINAG